MLATHRAPARQAAADLAGLLKNETELGVVLWGVKAGLDTSSAVLFLIAVGTVVSGSIWSARDHMAMKAQLSQVGPISHALAGSAFSAS